MPKTVLETVQEVIGKYADLIPEKVKADNTIGTGQDINLDSLDQVEMIMALEDALNIKIPDEAVKGIKSVQDILDIIQSKTGLGPQDKLNAKQTSL